MINLLEENVSDRIEDFKKRIEADGLEFCEELFEYATLRLLAYKYSYYVETDKIIDDVGYDICEKSWYVMGRALSKLKEDETSPCVDFDTTHPMSDKAIELYKTLSRRVKYENF